MTAKVRWDRCRKCFKHSFIKSDNKYCIDCSEKANGMTTKAEKNPIMRAVKYEPMEQESNFRKLMFLQRLRDEGRPVPKKMFKTTNEYFEVT